MSFHQVTAYDNGTSAFDGRETGTRCKGCGGTQDKRSETLAGVRILKRRMHDISSTFDNQLVVSKRFKDVCEVNGLTGAVFREFPADPGFYALSSDNVVEFDAEAAGVKVDPRCSVCGRYAGAYTKTVRLKNEQAVPDNGFAETDMWFASVGNDGMYPLLLCGDGAARVLEEAKLKGLLFAGEVSGTGVSVPQPLWDEALPRLKRLSKRRQSPAPEPISLRLRSGRTINDVVVDWSGQVVDRLGPESPDDCDGESIWEEGPDFLGEEIVAIGIPNLILPAIASWRKWFEM